MRYFIAPIQPKKGGYALLCSAYIQVSGNAKKNPENKIIFMKW